VGFFKKSIFLQVDHLELHSTVKSLKLWQSAKVFQVNHINKDAEEQEASLFSKFQHPNVGSFVGYAV
jgi:hypothetical protein